MNPLIISIVSKKGSGKTTLLEKLIPELKRRGYRVGTVKHDTHGFDIDHEGKDTYRHKASGADSVLISCPWKLSLIKDTHEEIPLRQLVDRYMKDMDIVLTEGYKRANMPQVEVFRGVVHNTPLHNKGEEGSLIAVMSDQSIDIGVPILNIDDARALADLIEDRFLRTRTKNHLSL